MRYFRNSFLNWRLGIGNWEEGEVNRRMGNRRMGNRRMGNRRMGNRRRKRPGVGTCLRHVALQHPDCQSHVKRAKGTSLRPDTLSFDALST